MQGWKWLISKKVENTRKFDENKEERREEKEKLESIGGHIF